MRHGKAYALWGAMTAVMLGFHAPASAIVINDTAGSATAIALGTPFDNVVELNVGGGLCSGGLISNMHVVTAQHCTFGTAAASMTVNFHTDNDAVADFSVGVSAKAEFDATSVLLDGTDIAVLTLDSLVNTITPLSFAEGILDGALVDTVGFGLNGLGSAGHGGTRDGKRWAAENVMDSFGAALNAAGNPIGSTANILNTDFDDGTAANNKLSTVGSSATPLTNEGTTAPGDSGGPLLVNGLIAGVLSGGTTATSVFGDVSWWTGTFGADARSFILDATDGKATYVSTPELATLWLMLLGLLSALGLSLRVRAR